MKKIIGIVGWKNNGKTTLMEQLIAHFTGQGLRVAAVKNAHHDFDIDHPGKDSWRHRKAGAREVIVNSQTRWALVHESQGEEEPTLEQLLAHLSPCDLVFVEGFKHHPHTKIEVCLAPPRQQLVAVTDSTVIAVATNDPKLAAPVPLLDINNVREVASFIRRKLGLPATD